MLSFHHYEFLLSISVAYLSYVFKSSSTHKRKSFVTSLRILEAEMNLCIDAFIFLDPQQQHNSLMFTFSYDLYLLFCIFIFSYRLILDKCCICTQGQSDVNLIENFHNFLCVIFFQLYNTSNQCLSVVSKFFFGVAYCQNDKKAYSYYFYCSYQSDYVLY